MVEDCLRAIVALRPVQFPKSNSAQRPDECPKATFDQHNLDRLFARGRISISITWIALFARGRISISITWIALFARKQISISITWIALFARGRLSISMTWIAFSPQRGFIPNDGWKSSFRQGDVLICSPYSITGC
uniref:Uncharacterized protein n=1 Tax=Ditylenchus dipsaci TaxID=166011 RepID=A0A915ESW2_9BILA